MAKTKKSTIVSPYQIFSSLASLTAGVFHLTFVASSHKDIPLEALFFISIGLAQIAWAIWFYRTTNIQRAYLVGLAINGSVLVVWLLSRLYETPFGGEVEAFGALDSLIAVLQAVAITLSVYCVVVLSNSKERRKYIALAILVPIVSGVLLFAGGRVTALLLNIETAEHGHEENSSTESNHEEAETNPAADDNDEH